MLIFREQKQEENYENLKKDYRKIFMSGAWMMLDLGVFVQKETKNLATEMTNYNVEEKDLKGERAITTEHVQNNTTVREMLATRGIKPEELPPSEDIKKLERKVKSQEKKIAKESGVLPKKIEE